MSWSSQVLITEDGCDMRRVLQVERKRRVKHISWRLKQMTRMSHLMHFCQNLACSFFLANDSGIVEDFSNC